MNGTKQVNGTWRTGIQDDIPVLYLTGDDGSILDLSLENNVYVFLKKVFKGSIRSPFENVTHLINGQKVYITLYKGGQGSWQIL